MEIKVEYGEQFEFQRVKTTLNKLDWYNQQGYRVALPKGITRASSDESIKKQIKKEYSKKAFDSYSMELLCRFNEFNDQFEKTLKEIFTDKIPVEFEVYLTRYGVGGSYNLPNKIIKNFTTMKEGIRTLVHEITHLMIQKEIEKYGIEHWEKERIVDLILNSDRFRFLKYNEWQGGYKGAERYVDLIFKKLFFKNQEKFFSELQGRNH